MPSQTLARRVILACVAGAVTSLAVLSFALIVERAALDRLPDAPPARAAIGVQRAADAVTQYLAARRANVELLADLPDIAHAARLATVEAKRRGLVGRPISVLERELDSTRALSRDPRVRGVLTLWRDRLGFSEVSFTERDGYAVLGTERVPDFVQSDEDWWQRAFATGFTETAPQYDPSAGVVVELAARITDPSTHAPTGVIKATLPLAAALDAMVAGETGAKDMEIVDRSRRVIVSRDASRLLRQVPVDSLPPLTSRPSATSLSGPGGSQNVAAAPTHDARWWVIARSTVAADDRGPYWRTAAEDSAASGALALLIVLVLQAWWDRRRR
ncbi:MAG TPA: hypothetical protein VGI83_10125 [Gemmatimonadales bacterium]|jgi:hypothetical protein